MSAPPVDLAPLMETLKSTFEASELATLGFTGEPAEATLGRFLQARKFDVEKTIAMMKEALAWRAKHDPKQLLLNGKHACLGCDVEEVLQFYAGAYAEGQDKEGRPIWYERTGMADVPAMHCLSTDDKFLDYHVCTMEELGVQYTKNSARFGKTINSTFSVLDLQGVTLAKLGGETMAILKRVTAIDSLNYPETMGKMFVINAPGLFTAVWSVIQGFLDPRTVSKIQICDTTSWQSKIREYVSEENLPLELGGKGPACLPTTPCFTQVSVTSSAPLQVSHDLAEGEEIRYKFFTRNTEMEFSAVFSVDGQKPFGVIPPKLFPASECSNGKNVTGVFQAPMAGRVTFVWKHAGWFARTVFYRLKPLGDAADSTAATPVASTPPAAPTVTAPIASSTKPSVMFVCVHNAARSQMAEGYGKELLLKTGLVSDVQSSGLEPTEPNPSAIKAMADVGIDISAQTSQHLNTFKSSEFELVVSLCGCGGTLPEDWTMGENKFQDWDLKDPEGGGDDVFVEIRNQVEERMKQLAAVLVAKNGELAVAVGNMAV